MSCSGCWDAKALSVPQRTVSDLVFFLADSDPRFRVWFCPLFGGAGNTKEPCSVRGLAQADCKIDSPAPLQARPTIESFVKWVEVEADSCHDTSSARKRP
jgi:hypothetical protein